MHKENVTEPNKPQEQLNKDRELEMCASFKDHQLSDHEKLWLQEIYNSEDFDPRVAKVKLRDKLPREFDPEKIDNRLLINGKELTMIGLWHADPNSAIFKHMEMAITAIRDLIIEKPGIEMISAREIALKTNLDEGDVEKAFRNFSSLGRFFSSASGSSNAKGYSKLTLSGDDSYDAYLNFGSIEDLMEEYYGTRTTNISGEYFSSKTSLSFTDIRSPEGVYYPQTPETGKYELKRNKAFILMAMDSEDPELEDVYQTIKDVCASYDIKAYRANEIEHQDRITDRILSEIKTCEFLIADLSHERPNVYYEIGYAHANKKRQILYRKKGTKLHFDLLVHNVHEYKNITDLRELLNKRLEAILGRSAK